MNKHLIYKYKNRKLYSKEYGQYVSINDVVELVRKKANIQVIDYTSNTDITNKVLKQAFLRGVQKLPTWYLKKLIQTDGQELLKNDQAKD